MCQRLPCIIFVQFFLLTLWLFTQKKLIYYVEIYISIRKTNMPRWNIYRERAREKKFLILIVLYSIFILNFWNKMNDTHTFSVYSFFITYLLWVHSMQCLSQTIAGWYIFFNISISTVFFFRCVCFYYPFVEIYHEMKWRKKLLFQ